MSEDKALAKKINHFKQTPGKITDLFEKKDRSVLLKVVPRAEEKLRINIDSFAPPLIFDVSHSLKN